MAKVQPVTVHQLKCSCGDVLQYVGIQDAILNLNNVDLFTHEVREVVNTACLSQVRCVLAAAAVQISCLYV